MIAAAFLAAEAAVRLAYFGAPAMLHPWRYSPVDAGRANLIEPVSDPRIRYTLKPGVDTWLKGRTFTTNSIGFRGPEITREKPAGVFRIAAIGASICMGSGVGDDEVYTRRLQARFDASDPGRFEVMNFAAAGYDLEQATATYEVYARPFEPDAVIVPLLPHFFFTGWSPGAGRRDAARPSPLEIRPKLDRSFAYLAAEKALSNWLRSDWMKRADSGAGRRQQAAPRALLRSFVAERREEGVEVWFVPLPLRSSRGIAGMLARAGSASGSLAASANVRLLDLRPAFDAKPADVDHIYFGDEHLGPRAHDLLAAAIFAEVAGPLRKRLAGHEPGRAGAVSPRSGNP